MPPVRYSPEDKQRALAIYVESGAGEASRHTGIKAGTIRQWARRTGVTARHTEKNRAAIESSKLAAARTRAEIPVRLLDEIHETFNRLRAPEIAYVGQQGKRVEFPRPAASDHFALVKSVGTLIDKLRLEEGKATERHESMVRDNFDSAVEELVAEMDRADKAKHGSGAVNGNGRAHA